MILDASDVTLPEMRVQAAVRDAFVQLGTGRAVQPSQTLTEVPGGGDVIAYQALLAEACRLEPVPHLQARADHAPGHRRLHPRSH